MPLIFHLAGINNQNFLMRDEQTGSFWQQITGLAISGPLAGERLTLVHSDEVGFALWRAEQPQGTVLTDDAKFVKEYAPKDWDKRMARAPTVISFAASGQKNRDIMLGVHYADASRAYPYDTVLKQQLIEDRVGGEPVIVVVGYDNRSVRVFRSKLPDTQTAPQFYRVTPAASPTGLLMLDSATGSQWNFQGCAIAGKEKGVCLPPVEMLKDYWFDWRNYNPATTIYRLPLSK